jgi:hypothetical protein
MRGTFHPSSLEVTLPSEKPERDNFVGVRENGANVEFCLPKGFDHHPEGEVTDIFFKLYKTFDVYQSLVESSSTKTEKLRDSGLQAERGITYRPESGESLTLFSKIPSFESLAKRYDLPKIYSIVSYKENKGEIDHSKIHEYLDEAVFLEDHTPYVNEMRLPSNKISRSTTNIVELYCFLYLEVFSNIRSTKSIHRGIVDTAKKFKKEELPPEAKLFGKERVHNKTIERVKYVFEDIEKRKKYRDKNYVEFKSVLEDFLYGSISPKDGGVYWGTQEFFRIWEDMCSYYLWTNEKRNHRSESCFVDSKRLSNNRTHGGQDIYRSDKFDASLYFSTGEGRRYIRPDYISAKWARSPSDYRQERLSFQPQSPTSLKIKGKRGDDLSTQCIDRIMKRLNFSNAKRFKEWSVLLEGVMPNAVEEAKDVAEQVINERLDQEDWESQAIIYDIKYKSDKRYKIGDNYSLDQEEIRKQLLYEYAVSESDSIDNVTSVFILPGRHSGNSRIKEVKDIYPHLEKVEIGIKTVDFTEVQNNYNSIMYASKRK